MERIRVRLGVVQTFDVSFIYYHPHSVKTTIVHHSRGWCRRGATVQSLTKHAIELCLPPSPLFFSHTRRLTPSNVCKHTKNVSVLLTHQHTLTKIISHLHNSQLGAHP